MEWPNLCIQSFLTVRSCRQTGESVEKTAESSIESIGVANTTINHYRPCSETDVTRAGCIAVVCSLIWRSWVRTRRESTLIDWMSSISCTWYSRLMITTSFRSLSARFDSWYSNGKMMMMMMFFWDYSRVDRFSSTTFQEHLGIAGASYLTDWMPSFCYLSVLMQWKNISYSFSILTFILQVDLG